MAGRSMGREARRYRHLEDYVVITGHTLDGDENAPGADVHGGSEFEYGAAFGVGSVNKDWKCDW